VLVLQVTAKLAAVCVPALQSADGLKGIGFAESLVCAALVVWLNQAVEVMRVSPESRAAAAVRQQLQDSGLVQHLGTALQAAADALELRAAMTACCSASADPVPNMDGAGTTEVLTCMMKASQALLESDHSCGCLLRMFQLASCVLAPKGDFSIEAALPAAPAAVRLMLKAFQAHSKIQEVTQQPLLQHGLWQGAYSNLSACITALEMSTRVMWMLAEALQGDVHGMMRSCPAVSELLLSPEIVSCLAITSIMTVLGPDVSSGDGTGPAATQAASSSSSSSRGPSSGGSAGRLIAAGRQQQPSSAQGSSSSLGHGVRLDSLTPLSCNLFDILGVNKETALQATRLATSDAAPLNSNLHALVTTYCSVLQYQVSWDLHCLSDPAPSISHPQAARRPP
jgi:hypothetical protein